MAEYITLMGAEQVSSAASRISQAADIMRSAGGNIDDALERHRRFMDDWLQRLEQVLDADRSAR